MAIEKKNSSIDERRARDDVWDGFGSRDPARVHFEKTKTRIAEIGREETIVVVNGVTFFAVRLDPR